MSLACVLLSPPHTPFVVQTQSPLVHDSPNSLSFSKNSIVPKNSKSAASHLNRWPIGVPSRRDGAKIRC
jgi:hypothetical protein